MVLEDLFWTTGKKKRIKSRYYKKLFFLSPAGVPPWSRGLTSFSFP